MKKWTFLKLLFLCHSLTVHSIEQVADAYDPFEFHSPMSTPIEIEEDLPIDASFPDLEESPQDFVLETKKLEFEGFRGAFNPSMIRYQDSILMAFRARDSKTGSTNPIALVWLDDDFNLLSPPQILEIPTDQSHAFFKQQDPRLILVKDRLFMVFSNLSPGTILTETRRMFVTEIHHVDGKFVATLAECLHCFEGEKELRWEKNWVPFEYNHHLYLAYSLFPHRILFPELGTNSCTSIASSSGTIQWKWGVLRGGTQAQIENGQYLGFFHSSLNMATKQSLGKMMQHYFMGAYTFSAEPPFEITQMSKEPIIGQNFYNGPAHKTWKPLRVVFPCGYISDDKYIWISYGRQDHEIWVAKLDKQGLFDSLVPVTTP